MLQKLLSAVIKCKKKIKKAQQGIGLNITIPQSIHELFERFKKPNLTPEEQLQQFQKSRNKKYNNVNPNYKSQNPLDDNVYRKEDYNVPPGQEVQPLPTEWAKPPIGINPLQNFKSNY